LAAALHDGSASPIRDAACCLLACLGIVLIGSLFGRPTKATLLVGVTAALLASSASTDESLLVALLSAAAWSVAAASTSAAPVLPALPGVPAALLLAAASVPGDSRGWRRIEVTCGAVLGLVPALAWQPALAGIIWVGTLANAQTTGWSYARAKRQIVAGVIALVVGVAMSQWS